MGLTISKAGGDARVPFKATLYGPPGSGKTFTALLWAEALAARRKGRVLFIDTEHGSDKYGIAIPARLAHPEAFVFEVAHSRSFADILETLGKPHPYTCIIIDSMSHMWDAAFDAWNARHPGQEPELRDWGALKRPYRGLMRWVTSTGCDVILCGRQKNAFEDVGGKLKRVGVTMRAEAETAYEPDTMVRMEPGTEPVDGIIYPTAVIEKDRWGILAGRTFPRPSAATIAPIFPFLGETAPPVEDEEERAANDSALIDDDKAADKAAKSGTIMAEMQVKIAAATNPVELGAVAAEMKKLKRYMIEEHLNAMRVLYEDKRSKVSEAAMPVV